MQAQGPPQRPSQRRQGNYPDSTQPTRQLTDPSQQQLQQGSQSRTASGSSRVHGSRSSNPDKQISQIEKSVTHLLVATKQLLETLTQWSRGTAQEEEVSDVYVRLGYEFNLACRAFNSIGVETQDLGPVPDLLRSILEDTLSQPASPQALDNYLPRIRDIIINLLQGLKKKQGKLRSRNPRDAQGRSTGTSSRQASVGTLENGESLNSLGPDAGPPTLSYNSQVVIDSPVESRSESQQDWSSTSNLSAQSTLGRSAAHRRSIRRDDQVLPSTLAAAGTSESADMSDPSMSVQADRTLPAIETPFPHPPPPPPPQQDALTALQRGGDLERRASRRFSAYQIQRHLGASPNGVPVIPAAQHTPVPNRGREARESLNAVRSRGINQHARQKSGNSRLNEISPGRSGTFKAPQRISEERDEPPNLNAVEIPQIPPPTDSADDDSPTIKTPEEFHGRNIGDVAAPISSLSATVNGPLSPLKEDLALSPPGIELSTKETGNQDQTIPDVVQDDQDVSGIRNEQPSIQTTPPQTHVIGFAPSPPRSKELTLFLQYRSKIKKFVLTDGYEELTLARLQLAFIEKFAWNTHNNGVDLPEIYLQDSVSGVRYELEDLSEIKDRSVLVLNVEMLDEVKKHFDEGIGGLKTTLESVRSLLDGHGNMMQRFSDRQLEASKEMARLSTAPNPRPSQSFADLAEAGKINTASEASLAEVQSLRRDIAVLRQTYSSLSSDFEAAINDVKTKATSVKDAAANVAVSAYGGDAGRTHVNQGKKQLMTDSESLVNRVDDLSDLVEDLRKDVVTRGVRPRPRQLEDISKEIIDTAKDLVRMKEFLKREKPIWTKIWEQELNLVCTERDDLTQQEELMADLDGDLEDVTGVFKLVEEAMKQQNLSGGGGLRNASRPVDIDPAVDISSAKEGVLGEVRALKPNHDNRLEAIERAEKARLRELESRRTNVFQREIEVFIDEGKLKKTGGADEVERLRKIKDERARKENWDREQARQAERERKRAEEAAAAAAATTANLDGSAPDAPRRAEGALPIELEQDALQEGDVVFQDAPTGMTPQPTASDAHKQLMESSTSSIPPLPPLPQFPTSKDDEKAQKVTPEGQDQSSRPFDGPTNGNVTGDGKSEAELNKKTSSDDKSWWKPAIF